MNIAPESEMPLLWSTEVEINLGNNLTTSLTDDHWRVLGINHIACWEKAERIFDKLEYKDRGIIVTTDWKPVIKNLKKTFSVMDEIESYELINKDYSKLLKKFPKTPSMIKMNFYHEIGRPALSIYNYSSSISEYILYNIFAIMNLSSPASMDLFRAKIRKDDYFQLSNYHFESAIDSHLNGNWPPVKFIDLEKTKKWFDFISVSITQISKSRMEKAIFSMLHLCRSNTSPTCVIWIFYALETIFDTKAGENFRYLVYRIELLLNPTASESKLLKKNLRILYDIRSSFVHGGMEVVHPLGNEVIDRRVDDKIYELMGSIDFGFQLILSCIQEVIVREWSEPRFEEVLKGTDI